jgi:hypothetical protein
MTSADLRVWAVELRARSDAAAHAHVSAARELHAAALTATERAALQVAANVHDCMSRRNRQWASALELVADELDEGVAEAMDALEAKPDA